MIKKASLLLCFITAVSGLQASPIAYNLSFNFTNGGGNTLPTAGSFTYNSSLAVNPFSGFTVTEGGILFDLTSLANVFTGNTLVGACKSAQSAAGFFNGLTGVGCQPTWTYTPDFVSDFTIFVCSLSGNSCNDGSVDRTVFGQGTGSGISGGRITATPAAAPEPGAVWLSGIGVLALLSRAWVSRRARTT